MVVLSGRAGRRTASEAIRRSFWPRRPWRANRALTSAPRPRPFQSAPRDRDFPTSRTTLLSFAPDECYGRMRLPLRRLRNDFGIFPSAPCFRDCLRQFRLRLYRRQFQVQEKKKTIWMKPKTKNKRKGVGLIGATAVNYARGNTNARPLLNQGSSNEIHKIITDCE